MVLLTNGNINSSRVNFLKLKQMHSITKIVHYFQYNYKSFKILTKLICHFLN